MTESRDLQYHYILSECVSIKKGLLNIVKCSSRPPVADRLQLDLDHFSNSSACTSEALDYSISIISASELAEAIWATLESAMRRDGAKLFPKDLRDGLTDGLPESAKLRNVQDMWKRGAGSRPP